MKRLLATAALGAVLLAAILASRRGPPAATTSPPPSRPTAAPANQAPGRDPASPAPAPRASRIRGQVTGSWPGIEVTAGLLGWNSVTATALLRTRTDSLGHFEFAGLAPGTWRLAARAPGGGPAIADVDLAPGAEASVVLAPPAGATLEVEARLEGAPAVAVRAEIWISVSGTEYSRQGPPLAAAETGTDGVARLAGLPPDQRLLLLLRHPLAKPHEQALDPAPGERRLAVLLDPGLGIAGRVVDPSGSPVAGAAVEATQGGAYAQETRSGPDGSFVLGGLENRPLLLRARTGGWLDARVQHPGPATGFVLVLRRPGRASGRDPGVPRVSLTRGGVTHHAVPGPDGSWTIEGLEPGTWALEPGGRRVEVP